MKQILEQTELALAPVVRNETHPYTNGLPFHRRDIEKTSIFVSDNRRVFNLRSQTLGNQKVSLFHWSEELERRWFWQREMDKIERWLESAEPEDVIILADFVAEESGFPKTKHFPMFVVFARQEIRKRLKYLGYVQLQKLSGMLLSVPQQIAA